MMCMIYVNSLRQMAFEQKVSFGHAQLGGGRAVPFRRIIRYSRLFSLLCCSHIQSLLQQGLPWAPCWAAGNCYLPKDVAGSSLEGMRPSGSLSLSACLNGGVAPSLPVSFWALFISPFPWSPLHFLVISARGREKSQIWRYHWSKWHLLLMWRQMASSLTLWCLLNCLIRKGVTQHFSAGPKAREGFSPGSLILRRHDPSHCITLWSTGTVGRTVMLQHLPGRDQGWVSGPHPLSQAVRPELTSLSLRFLICKMKVVACAWVALNGDGEDVLRSCESHWKLIYS